MEEIYCSDHSEEKPIAYCPLDKVAYCLQCFDTHKEHHPISINEYCATLLMNAQTTLLKKASFILSKAKHSINRMFQSNASMLDHQSSLVAKECRISGIKFI